MKEFLISSNIYQLYSLAFVFYFGFSVLAEKFLFKRKFDFKRNLISALMGLLFFVV